MTTNQPINGAIARKSYMGLHHQLLEIQQEIKLLSDIMSLAHVHATKAYDAGASFGSIKWSTKIQQHQIYQRLIFIFD